jgi:hypothetical protein
MVIGDCSELEPSEEDCHEKPMDDQPLHMHCLSPLVLRYAFRPSAMVLAPFFLPGLLTLRGFVEDVVGCVRHESPRAHF